MPCKLGGLPGINRDPEDSLEVGRSPASPGCSSESACRNVRSFSARRPATPRIEKILARTHFSRVFSRVASR